jgi:hypothetical protein
MSVVTQMWDRLSNDDSGVYDPTEAAKIYRKSTLTGGQSDLLNQLTSLLGGQLGSGVQGYGGEVVPGASELQQKTFDALGGLFGDGGMFQPSSTSKDVVDKIMAGTDVGTFDPTATQDWYQNALVNPAMENWSKTIAPQVQEKFIGQNAGSSGAANRAISTSASDVMKGLNTDLANALYGEKNTFDTRKFEAGQNDLNRMLQAPGVESQSNTSFINNLLSAAGLGGTQRDITSQQEGADYQKWLSQQGYNNPWLQMLGQALGTQAVENIPVGINPSLFDQAGLNFISAKRFKKNIRPIGKVVKGLPVCEFEYTEQALNKFPNMTVPGKQIGFIAEDVENVYPSAVIKDSTGRPLAINYSKLLKEIGD